MLDVFLNYACQAKCPFCYNPPLTPELVRWKLPLDRLAAELIAGRRRGLSGVTFSGGEVTLLKDLPKMLRLARKAGYSEIGIISNGLLMSEGRVTRELLDAGLSFCCISIHGDGAELHDRMVRVPGAFEKIIKTLEHLEKAGAPVVLNYVLTRENHAAAPAFIERFARLEGIAEFQLYYPHYDGLMKEHAEALELRMSDAVATLELAVAAARRLAAEEKVWVYNMPPCAAPALAGRLRNWEAEAESILIDPAGVDSGSFLQERRNRFKNSECRACSLDARCLGFERAYIERFGAEELRAVPAARRME